MEIERIEKEAAKVTGMPIEVMHKVTRKREIVWARQLTMYFARRMTRYSWREIGEHFGKDHATALYAHRRIDNLLFADIEIQEAVQLIGQGLSFKHIIGDWLIRLKKDMNEQELKEYCVNCVQL